MQLRHAHVLLIPAKAGADIGGTLHAIRASIGYPDSLSYRLLSPTGKLLEKGTVEAGRTGELRFVADESGVYMLELDPRRNACALSGRPYAIDLSDERRLQIIKESLPIYFRVPAGVRSFHLGFEGEAAKVTVIAGDGSVVRALDIPQYERLRAEIGVPAEQDGKLWSLKFKLAEDQSVAFEAPLPTVVSPWPEVLAALEGAGERDGFVRLDRAFFPRAILMAGRPGAKRVIRLKTEDGLALGLSPKGRVVDVRVNGHSLGPGKTIPRGGFFIRDVASGEVGVVQGSLRSRGGTVTQKSRLRDLKLEAEATFTPGARSIDVRFRLQDLTGQDRLLSVYFGLPVAEDGLTWWDDIYTSRQVVGNGEFGKFNSGPFGATGKWSAYPFATLCRPEGAVALGIPMTQPRLVRLAYNARLEMLYLACDVALVPETAKFPSAADFSFRIYTHDPDWGFRAAAQRYYEEFAKAFARRMPRYGGWVCWGSLEGMTRLQEYGFLYHWGGSGPAAAKFDDAANVYSFLYNDSVRYFADIGEYDRRPTRDEANAVFEQYLNADDPAAFVLSRPKRATGRARYVGLQKALGEAEAAAYLKRCVAAVRKSAATAADGEWVPGYIINRKGWGPENWWTGRLYCNPDPDIPGGYGLFLLKEVLGRTFAEYEAQGATLDGVGLDNFFVNALSPDCRRDHFAYADHPLTFLRAQQVPVIVGDFALYEWVRALKEWLGPDRYVIANTGRMPFPFNIGQLDINGYEWNIERVGGLARTMSYRKPVVTLPVKDEHYTEAWIKALVPLGFFPGGYADSRFKAGGDLPAIYRKYVPVIRGLNEAGWEPVTNARSSSQDVRLERFGDGGRILLTAHNVMDDRVTSRITVWPEAASKALPEARELLSGRPVTVEREADHWTFELALDAKDVAVVEVAFQAGFAP